MEKRQAVDGEWYTHHELQDHYGEKGQRLWDSAGHALDQNRVECFVDQAKHSASTGRVESGCEGGDMKPLAGLSVGKPSCSASTSVAGPLVSSVAPPAVASPNSCGRMCKDW